METWLPRLVLLVSVLLTPADRVARAYEVDYLARAVVKWQGDPVIVRPDEESFGAYYPGSGYYGEPTVEEALRDAAALWNNNPSELQFEVGYWWPPVGLGNDNNDVLFTDSEYWLGGEAAVTYAYYVANPVTWNISEADVLLDMDRNWGTSGKLSESLAYDYGVRRSLQGTLLHELGHVLGLNHEDRYYNLMGQDWDYLNAYAGELHPYPGEDACHAAVALYEVDFGDWREDLSVTHWKYTGADGDGRSIHRRCRVRDADGKAVNTVPGTDDARRATATRDTYGDPIFLVAEGHTIQVELSFENSGASLRLEPLVTYYLSTDERIDASDSVLAAHRPTLHRNTPFTFAQEMVLPRGLVPGADYYLLAFVDSRGEIGEVNGDNNKTYVRLRIR